MSAICGIVRWDGGGGDPALFRRCVDALGYYGPDGITIREGEGASFASLLFRSTPEDSFDRQPLAEGEKLFVFAGRLDNREELAPLLGIPPDELPTTPDSRLAFRAWCRWGKDAPDRLEGDWHYAGWDGETRTLTLVRDHYGISDLCWHAAPDFFIFASSPKGILAHPLVPRDLDEIKIAQILTAWWGEGWRTAYAAIRRLPPGHRLTASGGGVAVDRHWYPEDAEPLRYRDRREYEEEFLSLYRRAVRSRLRSVGSEVGATLSGGLDSGSVVSLAAPMLRGEGRTLVAWTSVPLHEPVAPPHRFGDEWEMASLTARSAGENVLHLPLRCEGVSLLENVREAVMIADQPVHGARNTYWIHEILRQAGSRGIRTLLTGQCGNGTVSFRGNGQFLLELSRGGWGDPLRALTGADRDILRGIKRQLLSPLLLPLRRWMRVRSSGGFPWRGYSAVADGFARSLNLRKLMERDRHDPTVLLSPFRDLRLEILKLDRSPVGALWHQLGGWFGVDVRDPTMDRRLVEFTLRVPDHFFVRGGERRLLIRGALRGVMPDPVLDNRRIGLQGADILGRAAAERESFADLLGDAEADPEASRMLDLGRMRQVLASLDAKDVATAGECSMILLRGLSAAIFLQMATTSKNGGTTNAE